MIAPKRLLKRLLEMGLSPANVESLPDGTVAALVKGECLAVSVRSRETCPCCGKHKLTLFFRPPCRQPLRKLLLTG